MRIFPSSKGYFWAMENYLQAQAEKFESEI